MSKFSFRFVPVPTGEIPGLPKLTDSEKVLYGFFLYAGQDGKPFFFSFSRYKSLGGDKQKRVFIRLVNSLAEKGCISRVKAASGKKTTYRVKVPETEIPQIAELSENEKSVQGILPEKGMKMEAVSKRFKEAEAKRLARKAEADRARQAAIRKTADPNHAQGKRQSMSENLMRDKQAPVNPESSEEIYIAFANARNG